MIVFSGSIRNRAGSRWIHIGGKLMQIDSGPFGLVYGVNRNRQIFCRTGISWRNPKGTGWRHVGGRLKQVSAGSYGVWGVNRHNNIYFRYGISKRRPQGTQTRRVQTTATTKETTTKNGKRGGWNRNIKKLNVEDN